MYMRTDTIESIILHHSHRGMNILREKLPESYCKEAAQDILSWERGNVLLTTGFYVAGYAETDGPVGTVMLAKALNRLGYHAVIVTDEYCKGFFEPEKIETVYMKNSDGETFCADLVEKFKPVGMISIERCGQNTQDDYANMRGVSIKENTAPVDMLFAKYQGQIPTIGVGDGGNEIGMGNMKDVIAEKLSLIPCKVCVDRLVIATVSNWGAYGIVAYLALLSGDKSLLPGYKWVASYLKSIVALGSVDGVSKENVPSVDGFPQEIEEEIMSDLTAAVCGA